MDTDGSKSEAGCRARLRRRTQRFAEEHMSEAESRMKIVKLSDEILELRYWDFPDETAYRSLKMPLQEARDFVAWWQKEGAFFKENDPSIQNRLSGSVVVSIFAFGLIHVTDLDQYGRKHLVGYSLPHDMPEALTIWTDKNASITRMVDRIEKVAIREG